MVATKEKTTSNIDFIAVENLLFDNENPRFAGIHDKSSQKEIAKSLWEEMYLDELIISIAVNGYYEQEPLLVIEDKKNKKYTVVEGNRRLASVKILTDPSLAKYVGAKDLPKVTPDGLKNLKKLPVKIYKDRKELWTYLSFRHVNGPRGWSPISKAEFIAHLHLEMNIDFDDILRSTGDRNRTSIKMFNGLMVLRQGERITRFTRDDFNANNFNFSHLYTIIQYPDTKKFLGIENLDLSKPFSQDPVPMEKKKELEELLIWVFGSKSTKVEGLIKSQNPDLRILDDIIGNTYALSYLRETRELASAHEYTKQEDRRLESYIMKAEINIRKAKSLEDSYKGDGQLVQKVTSILEISKDILKKMSKVNKNMKK